MEVCMEGMTELGKKENVPQTESTISEVGLKQATYF